MNTKSSSLPSVATTMRNHVSLVLAISTAVILMGMVITPVTCNDGGTNFFLKASKSVPRIGRRSENFFLKASKSVPRIGRRRTFAPLTEGQDAVAAWPWFRTADSIPGPSRRADKDATAEQFEEYLTWDEVEKAMEENPEMWTPNYLNKFIKQTKDDLDYQRRLQAMSNEV